MKKEKYRIGWFSILFLIPFMAVSFNLSLADCPIDEEFKEAMQKTEDEFKAFNQSMKDGAAKLEELEGKYAEYKEIMWSGDTEKKINLAIKLFNLSPSDREKAKGLLTDVREMFNKMDASGITSKLKETTKKLKYASGICDEVESVYDFAKKFDPANAREKPTYGLRLIGDILKEGSGKLKAIPLVGQILGPWVEAYAEVAGDFANALDRLQKTIQDFRQGALCGQSGVWVEEQTAFNKAAKGDFGGEDCLTYFAITKFRKLYGKVFVGQSNFYLFDPTSCRGYFANKSYSEKVYKWWNLLWTKKGRLDVDWFASRVNSMKPEMESEARTAARQLRGWYDKSENSWRLMDCMKQMSQIEEYGQRSEEAIVANYLLDKSVKTKIMAIIKVYEENVYAEGTVYEATDDDRAPLSGASIQITMPGGSGSATTGGDGTWHICLRGKPGESAEVSASKSGYETDTRTGGKFPDRMIIGWNFTLSKENEDDEANMFTISGTVYDTTGGTPTGTAGAVVTTSATGEGVSSGSTTTGGGGGYTVIVAAPENTTVSVTATKDAASGSNSVVVIGEAKAGVDIFLAAAKPADDTTAVDSLAVDSVDQLIKAGWAITVNVTDKNGIPLGTAVVSGGPAAVTTDAGGTAVVGPISLEPLRTGQPVSVTLSASISATGGQTVSGSAATVTYENKPTSAVTLVIPVESASEVTISGAVIDANGRPVDGAIVTSDKGPSATTSGGSYSLGSISLFAKETVTLQATITDENGNAMGGSAVFVTFDGVNKTLTAPTITLDAVQLQEVTISGRVQTAKGEPIASATVSGGGVSTVTDGSGGYTLPPVQLELGKSVSVSATVTTADGGSASGQTSVSPMSESQGGANIVIDVTYEEEEEEGEEDIDDAIDDMEDDEGNKIDIAALLSNFKMTKADLDITAADFYGTADFFEQRMRELRDAACESQDASYALRTAESLKNDYRSSISALSGYYGELVAAAGLNPGEIDLGIIEADYNFVAGRMGDIHTRYASLLATWGMYKCDEDDDADAGQIADEDADLDDVEGGTEDGGGVEICGDGVDNDGDNEIDECDAGCCTKNVQVTVTDCGNAADDVFLVAIDGIDVGVTPKGAANTFNVELEIGNHSIRITCLDDGGLPGEADDIGTVCVNATVYGTEQDFGVGGGEASIALGGSTTFGIVVPAGMTSPAGARAFNGSSLMHLEGR